MSETALQRARRETPRLDAEIAFARADFRELSTLGGGFEVVLSADNAVPHMLTADAVSVGFETVRWHSAAAVGFHQPVLSVRRATG